MRRRRDQVHSSLELMLDTITNTFGGVLFLAILVAILLQLSGSAFETPATVEISESDLVQLQQILTTERSEFASLKQAAIMQQELLTSLVRPEWKTQLEELLGLRQQRNDMLDARLETLQQIGNTLAKVAEIRKDVENRNDQLNKGRAEIGKLKAALASEVKARSQTARLPTARATRKREIAVVMRYGRLYWLHKQDSPLARELNTDDFVVIADEATDVRVTPKPYAGIVIDATDRFQDELRRHVGSLNTDSVYLAIATWEDSFDRFVHLKGALVDMGIEYRLMPLEDGSVIYESHVEKPMVQ